MSVCVSWFIKPAGEHIQVVSQFSAVCVGVFLQLVMLFSTLLSGHWLLTFYICSVTPLSYLYFLSQCGFILTSVGLYLDLVMLLEFG